MKRLIFGLSTLAAFTCASTTLASTRDNQANVLTHGMVQMTIRVGVTTQSEVLETFGGPNVTTIDASGQEMWVYDRHATVSSDSSSGFSIGMFLGAGGDGVAGGGGLGFSKKKNRSEQSTRAMTLILKFNDKKVVSDFRSRSSSF